ncbi:MAG: hypothetical protein IPP03_13450 [Dechloromonas sp.]|jgi:hypothetical protein|nr:hypothetical protein [Candidatus Dechloromonas phosphoritropha]MBP8788729.1 hypothetical protein [Azonexus sp.]
MNPVQWIQPGVAGYQTIRAIIVVAIAALLFFAGWEVNGWRKDADIADIKSAQASANEAAARQNLDALVEAERQGEMLSARATAAETARDAALQETQNALRKTTTGRPCLNPGTVRLLNDATGLKHPALPAPAGEPALADAGTASDTDVAFWIAYARRSYDTCRGRIDAIADFYKVSGSE